MAIMYEYQCKKCDKVQTKWHGLNEKNKESCEDCKSKRLIKLMAAVKPHGSWRVT